MERGIQQQLVSLGQVITVLSVKLSLAILTSIRRRRNREITMYTAVAREIRGRRWVPYVWESTIGCWRYTLMSAGLLWSVVMRKSERLSVLCVQSSLRHSCFEKCVSISHFANLLSFAFFKNHLRRAENLFCELEGFYANFGVSITVYWLDTSKFAWNQGGWKRT